MSEIINCPRCNKIFIKNEFRDVCDTCYKEEEKMFDRVYEFLRKRENRAATKETVLQVTGVDENLLYKWIKKGRIQTRQFPKLGYPCDKCGKIIQSGKICEICSKNLNEELRQFQEGVTFKRKQKQNTYYTMRE